MKRRTNKSNLIKWRTNIKFNHSYFHFLPWSCWGRRPAGNVLVNRYPQSYLLLHWSLHVHGKGARPSAAGPLMSPCLGSSWTPSRWSRARPRPLRESQLMKCSAFPNSLKWPLGFVILSLCTTTCQRESRTEACQSEQQVLIVTNDVKCEKDLPRSNNPPNINAKSRSIRDEQVYSQKASNWKEETADTDGPQQSTEYRLPVRVREKLPRWMTLNSCFDTNAKIQQKDDIDEQDQRFDNKKKRKQSRRLCKIK